jgi:holo-[acyl-carrier protein] synthase
MIVGLGTDLVSLKRVQRIMEKFGDRFPEKILGPEEIREMPPWTPCHERLHPAKVTYVAGRFAAKEAAVKALGTGFAGGVGLPDVETLSLPSGQPRLFLRGRAALLAEEAGVRSIHVSLSHERDMAVAVVILEG